MKIFKAIKKGFTLVELVIVIAVIAVLSAVLIPVFGNVVKDSRVSALKASLKTCTSNLIMYSLYNQVDYYTPSVIREFLKSEGIKGLTSDDSEFCEDGYSIWYNQQNYNFYLVKNDELADFVGGGTSSASVNNRNTAAFATDIFGNVADGGVTQGSGENAGASAQLQRIPRRPEAITPDENLLLLATDEANKYILSGIEALYYGADTDKGESSAQQVIFKVQKEMDNGNLFASFNRNWNIEDYTQKFDIRSTAWLNNVGNFVTDASFSNIDDKQIADITNVIVSPYLGSFSESETNSNKIVGNIRDFGKNEKTGAVLNVKCVIEIASANSVELVEEFYKRFSNAGVNIVISGNVSIDSTVSSSVSSGTNRVSTVTGGGKNISSVVNAGGGSAVSGGGNTTITTTIPASEFLQWTTSDSDGKKVIDYSTVCKSDSDSNKNLVSVKLPDGKVKYETVDKSFFDNNEIIDNGKTKHVEYKYNTSTFSVNVSEFLKKVGITRDDQVRSVKIISDAYNNVYSTSVYLEYEVNNVIYGSMFKFGVGHITSFDYYYRFFNKNFDSVNKSGENTVPQYFAINDNSEDSKRAGSLTVKLPEGTLNLQSYKNEDFTIEVYYNETTRYYTSETSEFGTVFKVFSHDEVAKKENSVTWGGENGSKTKIGDYYVVDFGPHDRLGNSTIDKDGKTKKADYFVNTVKINRIVIKDKAGNIMIVKYPG